MCKTYCFGSQLALAFLACVHCSTAIASHQFRSATLPMTPPQISVSLLVIQERRDAELHCGLPSAPALSFCKVQQGSIYWTIAGPKYNLPQ